MEVMKFACEISARQGAKKQPHQFLTSHCTGSEKTSMRCWHTSLWRCNYNNKMPLWRESTNNICCWTKDAYELQLHERALLPITVLTLINSRLTRPTQANVAPSSFCCIQLYTRRHSHNLHTMQGGNVAYRWERNLNAAQKGYSMQKSMDADSIYYAT
jgi:hypothetical protein